MKKFLLLCILPLCSCASHNSKSDIGLASGGVVDMALFPEMDGRTVPISKVNKSGQVAIRRTISLPVASE